MDYTIMEYDMQTGKYTVVGYTHGDDSDAAKKRFMKENEWKPRKGIWLFAKGPVCR